jgi:hypothetical protein
MGSCGKPCGTPESTEEREENFPYIQTKEDLHDK